MKGLRLPRRALGVAALGVLGAPPLRAQDPSGVLGEVLRLGRLRAGVLLSNPPWGQLNPWGEPDGYEVALIQRLAVSLSVRLDLTSVTPEQRVAALERGEVDVVAAALPIDSFTLTRIALSRPYGMHSGTIAMRAGEETPGFEGLRGRRVGIAVGTYIGEAAARALPSGAEAIFLPSYASSLEAVANRDADGAAVPAWMLRAVQLDDPETPLRQAFVFRHWRLALGVGLGELDLLHYVNGFLRVEQVSGSLERLQRLFFRGVTFDVGPSP